MQFVILDLEWNGAFSKKKRKFINEIIEVGAVKFDGELNIIDEFSMLIKPQIGKKISGKVTQLTHISNEELLSSQNTYTHVMSMFKSFSSECIILTWGITDIYTLMENNDYYLKTKYLNFIDKYVNLQSYCESCLNICQPGRQMGLSTAAELLNIEYGDENLHRALDDSILSYRCFKKLYDEEKLKNFIQYTNSEFYDRVAFKNTVITDIESPLIDKNELYVKCDKCGTAAKPTEKWTVKNRSFRTKLHCEHCNRDFYGRVQFKLKFDGVQIKKSVFEIPSKKEKSKENAKDNFAEKGKIDSGKKVIRQV